MIVFLLLLPLVNVYAADWQYTGGTKDGSTFYDAESIQYPDKDSVRVWVKSITSKAASSYFKGKKEKKLIDDAATKMASGYVPNYLLLESVKRIYKNENDYRGAIAEVIADEIIANEFGVHADVSIYYQIDCKGKRIGTLSFTKYRKDTSVETSGSTEQPKYDCISPDSTGEWLSMLVCPKG
jgi:hypothetical protein